MSRRSTWAPALYTCPRPESEWRSVCRLVAKTEGRSHLRYMTDPPKRRKRSGGRIISAWAFAKLAPLARSIVRPGNAKIDRKRFSSW